ncbi:MAG: 1-(5-phosphoribosyl)-5-[(5-phosphoribosylamino)methylideneamino]imidazole-4-carboxamide isomerase, partial [Rikenellaceae bacterium]
MIEIIPATDIIGGECVRLSQGDYARQTTYYRDPLDAAKQFEDAGIKRLHMVDLDGAKASAPMNLKVLERVATHTSLIPQWGGGIKSTQALTDVFNAGAARAIVGSLAVRESETFATWLDKFGGEKMVLGADLKGDKVAIQGWLEESEMTAADLFNRFMPHGLKHIITTDISRDGMMCGAARDLYVQLMSEFPSLNIIASGGISKWADVEELEAANVKSVIVGKALYEGGITLKELEEC